MGEIRALIDVIVGLMVTYGLPIYCIARIGLPEIRKGNVEFGVVMMAVASLLMITQTAIIVEGIYKLYHRRRQNPQL